MSRERVLDGLIDAAVRIDSLVQRVREDVTAYPLALHDDLYWIRAKLQILHNEAKAYKPSATDA